MSRSKRAPYFTEGYGGMHRAKDKRIANKAVRRNNRHSIEECLNTPDEAVSELADGKAYRKVYDPWNICDYKFFSPDRPEAGRK